jgi:hypothetical protein
MAQHKSAIRLDTLFPSQCKFFVEQVQAKAGHSAASRGCDPRIHTGMPAPWNVIRGMRKELNIRHAQDHKHICTY